MLYPAFYWTQIFGYSMSSFYSYLSLLEGLQFAVLILVLQRYVPSRWRRYAVFVALLPILFNTPLGLNSNGMRKLAPVLIILLVTARARSLRVVTGASVLLGLQLAYSHEYGLACLAALIGMYGVMAARREGWYAVLSATILTVGSIATWFTATHLLMGDAFSAYLERSLQLFRYFSQGGSAFRFYWTLNSLALFGLLAIACVWVGSGLFAQRRRLLNPGDRLTLAGLLFALVALKGGLNRSDLWHLNAAFLALTRVFLLSSPTRGFAFPWGSQKIALSLIGIVSVTYLVGIAPTGSFYAAGYVRGLVDVLVLSKPTARESAESRVPTVQLERTDPDPNILGLGEYLAEDTRSDRPVFFYNELWLLPIGVGACREDSTLGRVNTNVGSRNVEPRR